jgi:uncharacterized membrane protein
MDISGSALYGRAVFANRGESPLSMKRSIYDAGLLAAAVLAASSAAAQTLPLYRITVIPKIDGQSGGQGSSTASEINAAGVVAGRVLVRKTGSSKPREQVFRWTADTGVALMPQGTSRTYSAALAGVNGRGEVVGTVDKRVNRVVAWDLDDGVRGVPPGPNELYSEADATNEPGDVVGTRFDYTLPEPRQTTLWGADGTLTEIRSGTNESLYPQDVNARREVVGSLSTDAGPPFGDGIAFLWSPENGFTLLGRLPGSGPDAPTEARAINDAGVVAGFGSLAYRGPSQAFRWTAAGGYELLELPANCSNTNALDINNSGWIVGNCFGALPSGPYLWTAKKGFRFVADRIDPADPLRDRVRLISASAINDDGMIAGWGEVDGESAALVLVPVTPVAR